MNEIKATSFPVRFCRIFGNICDVIKPQLVHFISSFIGFYSIKYLGDVLFIMMPIKLNDSLSTLWTHQ